MAARSRDTRPLAERVHDRLASEIIDGTLKPGSALVQEQIALQYEVSRTPVRDALTQIAMEGLATLIPGSGYVVNDLTAQDIKNVFEVRYHLESLAVQQSMGNYSPKHLVRLRALIDEFETIDSDDTEEQFRLSKDFHLMLVDPCPNKYLVETLQNIWAHPIQRRITRMYNLGPEHQASVIRAHREVLQYVTDQEYNKLIETLRYCHEPEGLDAGRVTQKS